MTFDRPDLLWLLPTTLLLLTACFVFHVRRRRHLSRAFGGREATRRLTGVDPWPIPGLRYGAVAGAAAALAIAVLGPRDPEPPPLEPGRAIDAVVVLDISRSMTADDVDSTRLVGAKAATAALLEALPGDRVGLVAFAYQAYPLAPPTADHQVVRFFLEGLDPGLLSRGDQGSRLLEGIRAGGEILIRRGSPEAHRVLVLVSDGESHDEEAPVLEAVRRLAVEGIRTFTIGVGTEAGAELVRRDFRGNAVGSLQGPDGRPVVTRLDPARLARIAEAGEGRYLGAVDPGAGAGDSRTTTGGAAPTHAAAAAGSGSSTPAVELLDALDRRAPGDRRPGRAGRDLPYRLGVVALVLLLVEAVAHAASRRRGGGRERRYAPEGNRGASGTQTPYTPVGSR